MFCKQVLEENLRSKVARFWPIVVSVADCQANRQVIDKKEIEIRISPCHILVDPRFSHKWDRFRPRADEIRNIRDFKDRLVSKSGVKAY